MKTIISFLFFLLTAFSMIMFATRSTAWVDDTPADMRGIAKLVAGGVVAIGVSLMSIFMLLLFKDDD